MLYYEYISYSYNYTIKLYLHLDKRKTPCFNVAIRRKMLYFAQYRYIYTLYRCIRHVSMGTERPTG